MSAVLVAVADGGTAVAADKLTLDEPRAADLRRSSPCEIVDVVVAEMPTKLGELTTTSVGGGTTEKAFEDAAKSRRDAAVRRNMVHR